MQLERKGDTLVITANVSAEAIKNARPSSTGKTLLVDTINQKMGEMTVQTSIYVKNPAFVAPAKAKAA